MKIKSIRSQIRRDFQAEYECEHCGFTKGGYGYDDRYFHEVVVPRMECEKCGKIAPEDYVPRTPKYGDGEIV